MIYFAQPTNGGPIRIGASENVAKRATSLGTWMPGGVEFVAIVEGYTIGESFLHAALDPLRLERDWFKSGPAIWRVILEAQSGRLEWLPDEDWWPQERMEREVIETFGSFEAAKLAMGYSETTAHGDIFRQTKLSTAVQAKVAFWQAHQAGRLPDIIMEIHGETPRIEVLTRWRKARGERASSAAMVNERSAA